MKFTRFAGAMALALLPCVALAQTHATYSQAPGGYAPEMATVTTPADGSKAAITTLTGVALTGTATSTACAATSGACTIATGVSTAGPFYPRLGFPVHLLLKGTASFTAYIGSSFDGCVTINPLTAGGVGISYTSAVNEFVTQPPTTGSVTYCLVATVTSGTLTYAVRQ